MTMSGLAANRRPRVVAPRFGNLLLNFCQKPEKIVRKHFENLSSPRAMVNADECFLI